MEVVELIYKSYPTFFFVFLRTTSILLSAPFFGVKGIPSAVKIGLSMIIAVLLLPVVKPVEIPLNFFAWAPAILSEVVIGAAIGFMARLVMAGIELSGQMIGFQMGFGIVNIIDPHTNNQVSIIATVEGILALLIYFTVNAHHYFISAISLSLNILPPYSALVSGGVINILVSFSGIMFVTALKLGAPVMASILFANIAMGVIARTVPQINIFMMGFPITIAVGLIVLGVSMPVFVVFIQKLMAGMERDIYMVLKAMQ